MGSEQTEAFTYTVVVGLDWIVGLMLLCFVKLEHTWWIIMVDLEHLVAIMERQETKEEAN
jgi:hypothetical protein